MKKIRDFTPQENCMHPGHRPPMHIALTPGVWEHVCPGCGQRVEIVQRGMR